MNAHAGVVPEGFIRLDHAYDELTELLNSRGESLQMLWGSIAGYSPDLTVWTRTLADGKLGTVEAELFGGAVPHYTLRCGQLVGYNLSPDVRGLPLFVRQNEWKRWISALRPRQTASAEAACKKWLDERFNDPAEQRSKSELRKKAKQGQPQLSDRGFDRAWDRVAPPERRKAGRRKNHGT